MAYTIPGATVDERALVFLNPILAYCGPMKPGSLLAILDHESVMGIAVVGAGTTKLGKALGPWNVMEAYLADYGLTSTTVFDPEISTKKVCAKLLRSHNTMLELVPEAANDLALYSYLLYVAHNAGPGGMKTIINRTLAAKAHPIKVDDVRPYAAAYVGTTAREPGYYATAYGNPSRNPPERGALVWQQWVAPSAQVSNAPNPWVTPVLVTAALLTLGALLTAVYLRQSGSRSPLVTWLPRYA